MQRVVTILLLFSAYLLSAQSDQLFRNIKSEYGIASNVVNSVTQDANGFMWFATAGGLFRYDGYEIIPFKNDRSTTIDYSKDGLNVIEKNSENEIWVGSQSGLLFFDTSTGANRKVDLGGDRNIRCILKQGDSIIWAGSNDGLFKVNISDDSYVLYNQENSSISSEIIRSLYLTASNELWIGTFDGLNRLSPQGEFEIYNFKNDYKPELENNLILDIKPYSKANDSLLWVGTETGLVLFNTESKTHDVLNSQNNKILNEVVKCVYSKNPGQVYFGTDLGLYYYDVRTKEISSSFHDPFDNYSIANNVVSDIFEDVSGFLWLSTYNGISKLNYDKNNFEFTSVYSKYKNQIVGTQISNIYKDTNDDVWLATTHGVKVLRKDGSTQEFTSDKDDDTKIVLNNVGSITSDALGRIWIGSAGGINIWDPKTEKMFTLTANFDEGKGLRTNYISSFIQPDDGSFWVSTWGGGIYKVEGDFSNLNDVSFRFMADFNSGMFAADKKIWAFDNQKIYTLDVKTNEVQTFDTLNEEIKELRISSILVSKRGELWIGATDELIKYQIQSDKVQKFQIKTGKSSLPYNLVEDHAGNIWGTTLTSIFKFSISSNIFEVYPMNYGVTLDNFIPGSHTVTRDGQLFFGGNDGFISFYPDEIKKSNFKPNLLITNLTIRGKDINSLHEIGDANETSKQVSFFDKIVLDHQQNSLKLEFSSLHLNEPKRNIYKYKLEGYDDDWIYTTGDINYASYSNLPSGNYTFKVTGTNNDGVWFEDITSLNIRIKPSPWLSAIALFLYGLIFLTAVVFLRNVYQNRVKSKEEIKAVRFEKEKNEEIALSKQRLFTNISHDFLTPLNLILGPIDTLNKSNKLSASDSVLVSLIEKNAKRVHALINQLLDIRKIETNTLHLNLERFDVIELCQKQYDSFLEMAERKQINFRFEATNESFIFDGDRIRLESIIQNLLSNAFKFTPSTGTITIRIETETQSVIRIIVTDNGIGIPDEKRDLLFERFSYAETDPTNMTGNGIGLNIAKEYCDIMNGKIWYESELGKGSTFYVELPFQWIDAKEGVIEMVSENRLAETSGSKNLIPYMNRDLPILLLVEDDTDTLKYLEFSLKDHYAILSTNNGKEALDVLKKKKVDLIVSDVMMEEMDGIEFCKKIKQHPKFQHIPLLLLTAKVIDSQLIEGYQAGADAYLTKPFNLDLLKIQLKNLLAQNQKIDERIKQQMILGNKEIEVQSADEKLLQETIQYINEHITKTDINLEEMAHDIGVSYSSLFRKIKSQTGKKLNELVRDVRLKRAKFLLDKGKLSISEVIYETGFSSHSYFAKCFKKEFGVAPKTYLKSKNLS